MKYKIYWDNGVNATGVLAKEYDTEAQGEADRINRENYRDGVWVLGEGYAAVVEEGA